MTCPWTQADRSPGTLRPGLLMLCIVTLLAVGAAPAPAAAQELPLKRELPAPPEPTPCPAFGPPAEAPSEEDRQEAERLLAQAGQAAILGEHQRARELLEEAIELDPASREAAFQLGRSLEQLDRPEDAADAFCRYLALAPDGPDRDDAQARLDALRPPPEDPIPASARAAFEAGVEFYDAANYSEAIREFSRALVELPDWPPAHYNRGLAYLGADRQRAGLSDLEEYLELAPDASDRARVEGHVEELASVVPQYSASTALLSGMVVPGMGHFYTDRPGLGTLVLAAAGGSAAAGIFYKETEVDCLGIPQNGTCPPELIADQRSERPFLVPGLAAAGVVTVLGALHAARAVRDGEDGSSDQAARGGAAGVGGVGGRPGTGLEVELPGLERPRSGALGSIRAFLRVDPPFRPGESGIRSYLHLRF